MTDDIYFKEIQMLGLWSLQRAKQKMKCTS